jgi:spectrin beta
VKNQDLGDSVESVEKLQKKHELFEKSLLAQSERFRELDRVTTMEQREMRKQKILEYIKDHPDFVDEPTPITKNRRQFIEEYIAMHELYDKEPEPQVPTKQRQQQPTQSTPAAKPSAPSAPSSPTDQPPPVTREGAVHRKYELDQGAVPAKDRGWKAVYLMQRGPQLDLYKDHKAAKANHAMQPTTDLSSVVCNVAADYTKKKHVFRLNYSNGAATLFQAKDAGEMNNWVTSLNTVCAPRDSQPATFPRGAGGSGDSGAQGKSGTMKK